MRTKALILVGLITALPAFGQGTLTFLNTATAVGGSGAQVTLGGAGVSGTGFSAQLYAELTAGSFTAIGVPVAFRTGAAAGYVVSSQVAVPGFVAGTSLNIQMKAWDNAGGTVTSYEAALAGLRAVGFSNTINVGPLGGIPPTGPPITDPNLTGLTGFALVPIPEPSTYALLAFGAAALLLRRRKQ